MKIALVTDSFTYGGGLEHMYQICVGLPNIQFGVFGKDGYATEKFSPLSNVTIFNKGFDKSYINEFSPDIIHIHHLRPLTKLFFVNTPVIFTVHGVHSHKFEFKKGLKNFLEKHFRLKLEGFLYKRTNHLIFVSKEDEVFVNNLYKNLPPSSTIYNGIDFSKIQSLKKSTAKQELNFSNDLVNILIIARFNFQKGYDILFKTLDKVDFEVLRKFHFHIVGEGPEFSNVKHLITHNISKVTSFYGKRSDAYTFMRAADLFLLPSRWEGLPITLIESLACSLPFIASNTYGNREVSKLFATNSKLINFSSIEELTSTLQNYQDLDSKIDQEKLNLHFSLNSMVNKLNQLYRSFYG